MSMKISDGSSSVVVQSFPEEGPPILHIDDGTDAPCPPSPEHGGVAVGGGPEVGPPAPPLDPPPNGPMPDPGGGAVPLQFAAFRA